MKISDAGTLGWNICKLSNKNMFNDGYWCIGLAYKISYRVWGGGVQYENLCGPQTINCSVEKAVMLGFTSRYWVHWDVKPKRSGRDIRFYVPAEKDGT